MWDKCTEWPQNDLDRYKVKSPPYMCYYNQYRINAIISRSCTFHSISLYDQPFLIYREFNNSPIGPNVNFQPKEEMVKFPSVIKI